MPIERDLHELLYRHDCVIVPHWGGFLTNYRPARLDEVRRLVHPPGKDTSFNRNLTRNDGLLADHVAKREGIAFDKAADHIAAEVEQWRVVLQRSGRLELAHIGIFYHDAEHILQFDPDKRSDHLKDSFGLRPVPAIPVLERRDVPVIPIARPPKVVAEPLPQRPNKVIAWTAAGVAAMLVLVAAVWVGLEGDRVQWSSLSPFATVERTYVPFANGVEQPVASAGIFTLPEEPMGVQVLPLGVGDSVHVIVDLGTPMPTTAVVDTTRVVMPAASATSGSSTMLLRFHVIGGCFAQPENADRYLAELQAKGYDARRLPKRGVLHPVAFGSYASRSEALQAMEAVRGSSAAQAWLLVR